MWLIIFVIEDTFPPSLSIFSCNPLIGGRSGFDPVALTIMFGFRLSTNSIVASVFLKINKFFSLLAR